MNGQTRLPLILSLCGALLSLTTCQSSFAGAGPKVGAALERQGDELVACGRYFHTTTPIVLWADPGGYDAYRLELRFAPWKEAGWPFKGDKASRSPNRFSLRRGLSPELIEKVRGGGWDLPSLQNSVNQFVIHFDACGTSRRCFQVLHDERGLSIHFMLDLDGTIYQTLDLKEMAWHATTANGRSIGIEIANVGAYPPARDEKLKKWYQAGPNGQTRIVLPDDVERAAIRDKKVELRPARDEPVRGMVQGEDLLMYDLTPEQYQSLIRLTATLCTVFPKIRCDYPRDSEGKLTLKKLPDPELAKYEGILGHYHVQTNKVDPGPAFQWDKVIDGARALLAK